LDQIHSINKIKNELNFVCDAIKMNSKNPNNHHSDVIKKTYQNLLIHDNFWLKNNKNNVPTSEQLHHRHCEENIDLYTKDNLEINFSISKK